jgi:precorrin-2 dehydrogenase/sirohydrochlorin ferrochelatase
MRSGSSVPAEKRYYMACLDLEGRSVLVVGGGRIAHEKITGLLDCGADETVVAPRILPELRALGVRWLPRRYERDDLAGRYLVVAATQIEALNASVARDAARRSLLCNVVDDPDKCTVILPAIHREGPIAIAVSTGGASPALAKRLRDQFAAQVGPRTVALARELRARRPWAKRNLATYDERKEYFERLVDEALT